ncbi:MAG: HEAT repeat domain-containing protein [Leptolyngbyaceae cyanobacterium bins.349]|nr:HEAT repeat domain-containing protein [Leptolyngbyaceae cyanobacterium bins.349]
MSQLEDLLQQCAVQITIPSQVGWGTGFFVAPGLILTCAHVIKAASANSVTVFYSAKRQSYSAILESLPETNEQVDLALLKLQDSTLTHPCVYLDEAIALNDQLYSYGYPDDFPDGALTTFQSEALTGGNSFIKFKAGQVRPGMSGSPLLNQRTGMVCGIVKFTRDRSFDLGGGAIPTRIILEQFPKLRELQQQFHESDRRWSVLTSTGQAGINFRPYLEAVINYYSRQRHLYTPTDALLPLEARSVERPGQDGNQEQQSEKKVEQFPVLEGLQKYALGNQREHVLLAGRPGSGKSTTLRQLTVSLAEEGQVPVLVQLKGDRSVPDLIQAEFRRMKQRVTLEQIDEWLLAERLVLLLDGVNEIPNDDLRRSLAQFREDNLAVPMIFTTRDLSLGGNLGISKRLEMKPLSEPQMREFVGKYLPEHGDLLLGQLRDRLGELAETPLLLKLLCDVFDPETNQIPANKGELFRWFDRDYKRIKKEIEYVPVSENFWEFKSEILQYLAFSMIQGDMQPANLSPEPWLTITKSCAERTLEIWLHQRGIVDAPTKAKLWLKDLCNHHFLQDAAKAEEIEFHHQLFQEYYAAEYLLKRLPDLTDEQLKRDYLNYLKWTEPLALMLALVEEEAQALQVVKLAMNDVDLMLGARLAGEVKPAFQATTVGWIDTWEMPRYLKFQCWITSQSKEVISRLLQALEDPDSPGRGIVAAALGELGSDKAIDGLLNALEDANDSVRLYAANALGKLGSDKAIDGLLNALERLSSSGRGIAAYALGELGSDRAINGLLNALKDPDSFVRRSAAAALGKLDSNKAIDGLLNALKDPDSSVQSSSAAKALGELGSDKAIDGLLNALKDPESFVRSSAAKALGELGSDKAIDGLLNALEDSNDSVRSSAAYALGELGNDKAIDGLLNALKDPDSYFRRDSYVRWRAADAIAKIGNPEPLAALWRQQFTSSETYIYSAISAIQNRCKYYNHEIWQAAIQHQEQALLAGESTPLTNDLLVKIDQTTQKIDRRTQQMANEPKNNFSGATFNAPVNFVDNLTGDLIGTQNNYATNQEVQGAISDLQTLLAELQTQHPNVTTETEAIAIIDAEFTEIKQSNPHRLATLRKQLLNPERHLKATKAALGEVAKHYLEESVWAKTILTYLDKLSEDPGRGA